MKTIKAPKPIKNIRFEYDEDTHYIYQFMYNEYAGAWHRMRMCKADNEAHAKALVNRWNLLARL